MKTTFLFLVLLIISNVNAQEENQSQSVEKFDYKVDGYVLMGEFDQDKKEINFTKDKFVAGNYRYEVIGRSTYKTEDQDFKYVLVKILGFSAKNWKVIPSEKKLRFYRSPKNIAELEKNKPKIQGEKNHWSDYKDSHGYYYFQVDYKPDYIDITDQNKIFWLKEEKFNTYISDGFIKKRYYLKPQFAYGASLSLPFKIRPSIDTLNMKITPELAIGGYLGLRQRLDRYKAIYLYLPVVTAGVTTIGINSNNTINEQKVDGNEDGLIFARTFSVGSFIEFNKFQIGAVIGWDKAGGEIGKNWRYNDRLWYSFSIGYNFLRKNDD